MRSGSLLRQGVFRRLWVGSTASFVGTSASLLAFNWLVYSETHSPLDLAFVGVAGVVPRVAFGLFTGTLADRYSKLRLMVAAEILRASAITLLALSIIFNGFGLQLVLAAAFILGAGQSLFLPSAYSILPSAVPKEDLPTANGLFVVSQQTSTIIGGPLSGFLIAAVGAGLAILIDGTSYIISALAIAAVSMSPLVLAGASGPSPKGKPSFIRQLREGFSYVSGERGLLKLTLASFGGNFFLSLFLTYLVVYVSYVLAQGALTYGVLGGVLGAGFGIGSLLVGRLHSDRRFGVWFAVPWGIAALGILGLTLLPGDITSSTFLFTTGVFGGLGNATFLTGVQKYVPGPLLGRYLGLDDVGSLAAGPAGQIAGGLLIGTLGLNTDFMIAALGTCAFSFGLLLFPDVRRLRAG